MLHVEKKKGNKKHKTTQQILFQRQSNTIVLYRLSSLLPGAICIIPLLKHKDNFLSFSVKSLHLQDVCLKD